MKTSGIVRKVDELGRIVLPVEMRRILNISERDAMEISLENEAIVVRKHHSECVFCNSVKDIIVFKGRNVCAQCVKALQDK